AGAAGPNGRWLNPGEILPADHGPGAVVLLRCDIACVAGVLRDLVDEVSGAVAVRDDAGRVALVRTTSESLQVVPADVEAAAAGARFAPASGWLGGSRIFALDLADPNLSRAEAEARRTRAESELIASLDNPRDGVADRWFNRRLSRP